MKRKTKQRTLFFANMEQHRFANLLDIKTHLEKHFKGASVDIEFKNYEYCDHFNNDFEIMCVIEKENEYMIDLTLFFLYDRKNNIYITEFSFEEQ